MFRKLLEQIHLLHIFVENENDAHDMNKKKNKKFPAPKNVYITKEG